MLEKKKLSHRGGKMKENYQRGNLFTNPKPMNSDAKLRLQNLD